MNVKEALKVLADAIVEHQRNGQLCPDTVEALKQIGREYP